jgi:hypothetical protein
MSDHDEHNRDRHAPALLPDRRLFLARASQAALALFLAGSLAGCGEDDDDDDDDEEEDDDD